MPFDSTPQVTPALALLRAARAKIEDPRNWVKHAPQDWEMAAGQHCIVSSVDGQQMPSVKVLCALAATLPPGWWRSHTWQFNDAPETTHADIMMLFDRAERRLMEDGV